MSVKFSACRQYFRNHGTARPQWLIERAKRRKDSVKMCSECGAGEPRGKSWRYNQGKRVCRPCKRRYLREERRLAGHPQSQVIQLNETSGDSSSAVNGRDMKCDLHCSSESPPANSSVTHESLSSQSRVDLRPPANATNSPCLLTVKEEPTEGLTPDRFPSPPQNDQTGSCPTSSAEGNSGGEKERQQLWLLAVAELKKGHEIDGATLKIENLQKALSEATSDLQRMRSEMMEILHRKSDLLGIPIPNIFK
ncbi:hypothetical protein KIN20_024155 [Parelaphostrongylus tenuis]|uniref:Uncharacterized protein n=1 Tax=Parelaphostrongylus tenuis TaxID=148309 RepID=A0AAD5QVS4_PARTN|nr:hypothetical protein KIN20_024155 [Parelaphostrongylus tenuis]